MTFLDKLSSKIRFTKRESDDSYVASLNKAGLNKLEKIGEEATELIIAAKEGDQPKKKRVGKGNGRPLFHCLVLLDQFNLFGL